MRLWLQKKTWHCMSAIVEASWIRLLGWRHQTWTLHRGAPKTKGKGLTEGFPMSALSSCHPLRCSWVIRAVENSRACCELGRELVIPVSSVSSLLWKLLVPRDCCDLSTTVETEVEECDASILAAAVHYIHVFLHCLCILAWWLELWKLLSAWQVGLKLPTEDQCITTILFPFFKLHTWAS